MPSRFLRVPLRPWLRRFSIVLACNALLFTPLLFLVLASIDRQRQAVIAVQAEAAVEQATRGVDQLFFEVAADFGVLSRLPAMRQAIESPTPQHWQAAGRLFRALMVEYGRYPVMQVYDLTGRLLASDAMTAEAAERALLPPIARPRPCCVARGWRCCAIWIRWLPGRSTSVAPCSPRLASCAFCSGARWI